MDRNANKNEAGPSHHTANYFRIAGTEQPAQIFCSVVTENTDRLDGNDPACMEPDGKIEGAGTDVGVAEHDADQQETDQSWSDLRKFDKRCESGKQVAEPGQRFYP